MLDHHHHELLARIASLYYEQDLTQNEIAEQMGLSRVKVYRLLQEARQANVVQITIQFPLTRDSALEDRLKQAFRLKDAFVLRVNSQSETRTLQQLGQLGARYLENCLRQRETTTMAICLGRSTYEVIQAIGPDFQANVQVAQAIGNMPGLYREYDSSALAAQLARKLGGEVMYLSSPLMADTPEAAHVIRSQRDIERTLHVARSADMALIGIGHLAPESSGFVRAGFIQPDDLSALKANGAVGDLVWRIIQASGDLYDCEFNHRVIGITLDDLRDIPTTIAVASGVEKTYAILGALRTGALDVLCTDSKAAQQVLAICGE